MQTEFGLQAISFAGAFLILVAYAGHQFQRMDSRSPLYNLLNFLGSSLLAYVAFYPFRIGFVLLEVIWALVSLWALFRSRREVKKA